MKNAIFYADEPLKLESGEIIPEFQLFYSFLGELNEKRDNVIWVCHALTANSNVADWWNGLIEHWFSPKKYFIICANMLGSCYGSTSPLSFNKNTNDIYFHDFPLITAKDMVTAFDALRKSLKINEIHLCIGGSTGGQHAVEWAATQPDLIKNLVLIACNAKHSPWGIAYNEAQRMAIESDETWKNRLPQAGITGMMSARAMALISYRSYETYQLAQTDNTPKSDNFKAASYQRYQGLKLKKRFNAFSYWVLSKVMDSHDLGRGRESVRAGLQNIKAKTLVVGISSDGLFPTHEQIFMAENIPRGHYQEITSIFGHDGFLLENEKLTELFNEWYNKP